MDGTGSNTNHIESLLQSIYDSRKECEQRNDNDDNDNGGGGILRVLFKNSTKDTAKDACFNVHSLIAEQSTGCNSLFQQKNLKENNNNVVLLPEFIEPQLWLLCISWMYFGRLCFHPNIINHAKSKNISDNDDDDAVTLSTFLALWKVAADTGIDMKGLQQYCLERIEECLEYKNYETIHNFSKQNKLYELEQKSQRFQTSDSSRDIIVKQKLEYGKELQNLSQQQSNLKSKENYYQQKLRDVDKQWQTILKEQNYHHQLEAIQEENLKLKHGNDSMITTTTTTTTDFYPSEKFKAEGGIGHVVYDNASDQDAQGTAKYGEKDSSDNWDDFEIAPPSPPTKYHYETYGIVYSHGTIIHAIEKAESGDRIYIGGSMIDRNENWDKKIRNEDFWICDDLIEIDKSLEIISLDESSPENTIVMVCGGIRIKQDGCIRFANLTLKYGYVDYIPQDDDPLVEIESESAKLFMENCILDMGTELQEMNDAKEGRCGEGKTKLNRGIVSGILVECAETVVLNGCRFTGGCGSSVLCLYDPYMHWYTTKSILDIRNCSFSNTCAMNTKIANTERPSPPLSVLELCRIHQLNEKKNPSVDHKVYLTNNKITNNFNAAVGYRSFYDDRRTRNKESQTSSLMLLEAKQKDIEGDVASASVQAMLSRDSFEILFSENNIKSNGLGLDRKLWIDGVQSSHGDNDEGTAGQQMQKKQKVAATEESEKKPFPDGNIILAVEDIYVDMYSSTFNPYYFLMGEPCKRPYYHEKGSDDGSDDY